MKIKFVGTGCVPPEWEERNIAYARSLGLPYVQEAPRPCLAVVGGAPSINVNLDALKAWEGDVWAINGTAQWCQQHGIEATFFTADAHPTMMLPFAEGVTKAIVASSVSPELLDALDCEVQLFDMIHNAETANHWATSATCVPEVSLVMGYRDVSFFGCDSSYGEFTHAYRNEDNAQLVQLSCGGESFITHPELVMQAEYLAEIIRAVPAFKDRSGGFLSALVEHGDYDVTHISEQLRRDIADHEKKAA